MKTRGASRERVRFDANVKPHHPFVCLACGKVEDFFDDSLDSIRNKLEQITAAMLRDTANEVLDPGKLNTLIFE